MNIFLSDMYYEILNFHAKNIIVMISVPGRCTIQCWTHKPQLLKHKKPQEEIKAIKIWPRQHLKQT
jgi:hypothetical protein